MLLRQLLLTTPIASASFTTATRSLLRSSIVTASIPRATSNRSTLRSFSSALGSSPPPPFILKRGDKNTVDSVLEERSDISKYAQQVTSREKHTLLVDELGKYGGLDTGLSPYDLLLAALGGCTSMTLRMYADRRSLPLPPLRIELMHSKKMNFEVSECPADIKGPVDLFEVTIQAPATHGEPPLTSDQQTRLLEIAGRCPVHQTLAGNPRSFVRTRWIWGENQTAAAPAK